MRQLRDSVWQVRGTSWVWDEEARNQICVASEVWSLRQFCAPKGNGPMTCPVMAAERWWSPGWMAASIC